MKTILLLILLISFNEGRSQFFEREEDHFQKLTIESGLSKNKINCILRDKSGFAWFGTGNGLNRFDGKNVIVVEKEFDDGVNLKNLEILDLYESSDGAIWIASQRGLFKYDPSLVSIERFPLSGKLQEEPVINCIAPENDSMLWLGTTNGLKLFGSKTGRIIEEYNNEPYQPYSLSDNNVSAVCNSGDKVWVGTRNGLNIFDKEKKVFKRYYNSINEKYSIGGNLIQKIIEDYNGNIWIGTEYGGLSFYDESIDGFVSYNVQNSQILHNDIRDIFDLKNGRLWLATNGGGLSLFDTKSKKFTNYTYDPLKLNGLSNNATYFVLQDYEGILWVGFYGAGVNYNASTINNFKTVYHIPGNENSICENNARSMFVDSNNNLWIGTLGGLSVYDSEQKKYSSFISNPSSPSSLSFNAVTSVFNDSSGNMWVGTYSGGINFLKEGSKRFKHYRYNKTSQNTISSDNIYCIVEDSLQNIWAATSSGLDLYNWYNDSWQTIIRENIRDVVLGENEKLFLGIGGGIIEYDIKKQTFNRYINDRLSSGITVVLHNDNNEKIWFGTQGSGFGFFDLKTKQFTIYDQTSGLPSNFVSSIEAYRENYLWLSTYKGLSLFNKETQSFINYGMTEGVPFFEFHPRSSAVLPDGTIAFGGTNGIVYFDPHEVIEEDEASGMMFTSMKIDGNDVVVGEDGSPLSKSIHLVNEIRLKYSQNDFSFDFVDKNFKNLGTGEFAYKLENYMDDWNYIGSQNTVGFTNMDPGEYILRIRKVRGNFQQGFQDEISIKINIVSPFWMTWFFYVLLGLIAFGLMYLYKKYTLISISQKNEIKLKNLEYEKYEEFNKLRMKFFTYISHELRTPLSLIVDPLNKLFQINESNENQKYLRLIENNSDRLSKLVNQILDFRKLENDTLNLLVSKRNISHVISKIYSDFEETAKGENISYRFDNLVEADFEGWVDSDKIEKIMYNLLSNAFKFTKENEEVLVRLSLSEKKNTVIIEIADKGPGIRPDKLKHIFDYFYSDEKLARIYKGGVGIGLTYVKRLVDLHHGKISVESKINKGTSFKVYLPVLKEEYSEQEVKYIDVEKSKTTVRNKSEASDEVIETINQKHGKETPLILIVEDELELRRYLVDQLGKTFRVKEAVNGKEALKLIEKGIPDLILSDNVMPIMDGISLCNELKESDEYNHIPFVFLSAWNSDDFKIKGLKVGAEDYISKPFNSDILEAKLSNIINKRKRLLEIAGKMVKVSPKKVTIETSDERFILKAQEIIERNIDNFEFTTKQFEDELSMSHSAVYRKIKKLTGLSANEYIREFKIRRAAQIILQDSDLSVMDISLMVGFNDQKYFSRCFKKIIGVLPTEYTEKQESL